MEIFDISQILREGMAVWPGDPEFHRSPVLRIKNGDPSNVSAIQIGTHTGTHIDAPFHLDDSGIDISAVSLAHFIGPVRVVPISGKKSIQAEDLSPLDWQGVERVLFKTCSGHPPKSGFDRNFVYLEEDASLFLAGKGVLLIGTDAPSVDAYNSTVFGSHKILIRSGAAILEGVCLEGVLPGDYNLVCLPLKLAGADGSPVRAILWR